MTVQLTNAERVVYECAATGESTFQLFSRAFRETNKREGDIELLIRHVKAYIAYGHTPCYVQAFFKAQTAH